VATHLHERGLQVVVTGSQRELGLAQEVADGAGLSEDAVLAGRHDLAGLVDVVASAALVVCGDTGMGHLATALGTPSVLLFGPMPPRLWGPPATRPRHLVLWAGDVGDPHGQVPDSGLLLLTPAQVIAAVDRQLVRYPADREVTGVG
jgi:ADP-heptose:LPS heptosyltransferase